MRDYGKVHTSFWSSATIRSMSEDGRALAMYLLTSPHGTIAGVMRLPDGYICEDLQWSSERVSKGFNELFRKGFANRCETTKWVWIRKHFEWNAPENPNQRKSAKKIVASIPDECTWKPEFLWLCAEIVGLPKPNPTETVAEPFPNQEQEQEQKQDKDSLSETSSDEKPKSKKRLSYPEQFEVFWKAYPTDRNMAKKEAFDAWKKLDAEDQAACIAAIPGYRELLKSKPNLETLHACRFIIKRRFDGYAPEPPQPVDEVAWIKRLNYGRREGKWASDKWGPAPMRPGCTVPEHLLKPDDGAGWREMEQTA